MAKRASLSTFSPQVPQPSLDAANGGRVIESQAEAPPAPKKGNKYPHVSVYLSADEVRTLKLLSLETGERISEICATAVREWMERNGHARSG